jgi:hypothetical protein
MKKIYVIYIMIALFALQFVAAAPSLQVSLSKYEPYPASPGDTVKVWLLVQNIASDSTKDVAKNVVVELVPEYPFSMYGDPAMKTVGLLGAKNDYLIDFTLKVDEKALQGNNRLKVRVSDTSTNIQIGKTLDIFVQSRDTTIAIDSVKIVPEEIVPGSDGKITITVTNKAPTSFTDLNLKLFLQTTVAGVIIDLPFAPVDSSAEKRIYRLDSGQSADFTFDLKAYPDAVSKLYKIPFTLEYYDSLGSKKNTTDVIGVTINSPPDISIILDKTDITQNKMTGTVTLKVINKGLSDIKFLNVILKPSDNYEILSTSDTTYVGNLQSDDYQSVDYTISLKDNIKETMIPITIQYRDANNKYYEVTQQVSLNVMDASKLDNAKSTGSSATMIIIILLIVAIAGWIIYKRFKKNKKGQFN